MWWVERRMAQGCRGNSLVLVARMAGNPCGHIYKVYAEPQLIFSPVWETSGFLCLQGTIPSLCISVALIYFCWSLLTLLIFTVNKLVSFDTFIKVYRCILFFVCVLFYTLAFLRRFLFDTPLFLIHSRFTLFPFHIFLSSLELPTHCSHLLASDVCLKQGPGDFRPCYVQKAIQCHAFWEASRWRVAVAPGRKRFFLFRWSGEGDPTHFWTHLYGWWGQRPPR